MDAQRKPAVLDVFAELPYAVVYLCVVIGLFHVAQKSLGILLYRGIAVTEEQLARRLRLAEKIVDINADKDAYLFYVLQLLPQFEIARRTEIANYGMEDVEVGHCCGDAVELVHQRRLYIVEEFGAHDV